MEQECLPVQKINEDAETERVERLLHRLEELWQYPHDLTFEAVKRILTDLPEEDQAMAIEALAKHLFHIMNLHFLDILARYHQMAEEEGISAEERDEIANDVRQESLHIMEKLGKQLSVHSINDLVMLSNITFGLYTLSRAESAEQAERWLYKLPRMYRDRLEHERLVAEQAQLTATVSLTPAKSKVLWGIVISESSDRTGYIPSGAVHVRSGISRNSSSLVA